MLQVVEACSVRFFQWLEKLPMVGKIRRHRLWRDWRKFQRLEKTSKKVPMIGNFWTHFFQWLEVFPMTGNSQLRHKFSVFGEGERRRGIGATRGMRFGGEGVSQRLDRRMQRECSPPSLKLWRDLRGKDFFQHAMLDVMKWPSTTRKKNRRFVFLLLLKTIQKVFSKYTLDNIIRQGWIEIV